MVYGTACQVLHVDRKAGWASIVRVEDGEQMFIDFPAKALPVLRYAASQGGSIRLLLTRKLGSSNDPGSRSHLALLG